MFTKKQLALDHPQDILWARNLEAEMKDSESMPFNDIEVVAMYPPKGEPYNHKTDDNRAFVFKDKDTGKLFRSFASLHAGDKETGEGMWTWILNYVERIPSISKETKAWRDYQRLLKIDFGDDYHCVFIQRKLNIFSTYRPTYFRDKKYKVIVK